VAPPTTSTVGTVKAALVALLAARPGLAGVEVCYAEGEPARETVFFGDTRGTRTIPVATAGRKPRQEDYALDLFIRVARPDLSVAEAEARALALMAEVEDALADDPTLGQPAPFYAEATDFEIANDAPGEGAGSTIRFEVACHTRLS
jgi:hypothetical protein